MTESRAPASPSVMLFRAAPVLLAMAFVLSVGSLVLLSWRGGTRDGRSRRDRFRGCLRGRQRGRTSSPHARGHRSRRGGGHARMARRVTAHRHAPRPDGRPHRDSRAARAPGDLEMRLDRAPLASRSDLVGRSAVGRRGGAALRAPHLHVRRRRADRRERRRARHDDARRRRAARDVAERGNAPERTRCACSRAAPTIASACGERPMTRSCSRTARFRAPCG